MNDSILSLVATILFGTAINILQDGTNYLLREEREYGFLVITSVLFIRAIARLFVVWNFQEIIKTTGIFRSIVAAICLFAQFVILLLWTRNLAAIAVSILMTSLLANFVLIHMTNSVRTGLFGKFTTTVGAASSCLSSFAFPLSLENKILLLTFICLSCIIFFVFRDTHRTQNEWVDKGEGRIIHVFFSQERYFAISFIYSLTSQTLVKYLVLIVAGFTHSKTQIAKSIFLLHFGRLTLNYLFTKMLSPFHVKIKIIISSLWIIIMSWLISTYSNNYFIVNIAIFLLGILINAKIFIIEYFQFVRNKNDINVSVILTEQQIDTTANMVSLVAAFFLPFVNFSKGVFVINIFLHLLVISSLMF